ncbi:MAG TPA: DUF4173 domain-containing protein, partial [Bacteroidota bacterium]|nr:DUF4173 domain-containing protein [Bacteroidota bacterium]
ILRKDSPRDVLLFRSMAGLNLLLLGVIMASAWQRLILYEEAYGLTEPRLYAAAALTGMGLVAAWFALSVLSGRRDRFAFGSIIAAYAVILSLDILNPDALIARIDIARASEGKHSDPRYLATLSSDATPDLIAGLPLIPAGDRDVLSRELFRRRGAKDPQDWRTWNLARARAAALVRSHIDSLVSSTTPVSRTQEKEERTCTPTSGSR